MRIIVRYCRPYGNYATKRIDIDEDNDTSIKLLKQKIFEKFSIPINKQIIKFQRDGFNIRLVDHFSFSFYEIRENSIIMVEQVISKEQQHNKQYLMKLGLQPINEETIKSGIFADTDSEEYSSNDESLNKFENEKKQELEFKQKLDNFLKKIQVFDQQTGEEEILKEILQNDNKRLINTLSSNGWNAFHYSIYNGNEFLVKEFLNRGADINQTTLEGWNPLQLSVHKKRSTICQILLNDSKIRVNDITNKGTALHIACKNVDMDFVKLLLDNNADPQTRDNHGNLCVDECGSQEIINLLQFRTNMIRGQSEIYSDIQLKVFFPPVPPIISGWLQKSGNFLVNVYPRYFVCNPIEGTLVRYKEKKDFPLRPIEIISLSSIFNIQKIRRPWYMTDLTYFEIIHSSRMVLGAKNLNTVLLWVRYVFQAATFCNFIEDLMLKHPDEYKQIMLKLQAQNRQVIEVDDQPNANQDLNISIPVIESSDKSSPIKIRESNVIDDNPESFDDFDKNSGEKIGIKSFQVIKVLGQGSFGKVFLVKKINSGEIFAMKALKKRNLILKKQLRYAVTEANVLKTAKHPFILKLHYTFQTPSYLYMVIDYCSGGDLSLQLAHQLQFDEDSARFYIAELVLAIEYIHKLNIIYRDLKPENILIGPDGHIMLADFGLSKEGIGDSDKTTSFCGSPAYLSPEMIKHKGAGKSADIYGIGCVLYEMLVGQPPYYDDDIPKMYRNIQAGKLDYPSYVSEDAKRLLKGLLDRNVKTRLGVNNHQDIKNEPFFKHIDWQKVFNKQLVPPNQIKEEDDLSYAQQNIAFHDEDYQVQNRHVNRVSDFSFVQNDN